MVNARNAAAVQRLRTRKHRDEKPLALLFPSLESVTEICEISRPEESLLCSPEAPIVLLHRRRAPCSPLFAQVAPGNPNLGVMLPSNPLHHLLMAELRFPVVATSGNLSDEPICTDEREAIERLRGIADAFLVHNRPIVRHVDDSIVRVIAGREMVLRRSRGFAPLPIALPHQPATNDHQPALAVGAHLKNSVALAVGKQVFISQHIGDLETEQANNAFHRVIGDLQALYETAPGIVVADLHPDYLSTNYAQRLAGEVRNPVRALDGGQRTACPSLIQVQHHIAHTFSCMAENELEPPVLGVAWDGTGYGLDGTIWGGEFFLVTDRQVERVANLRPFRLPGGDTAVKEPRRAALGLLHGLFGDKIFQRDDLPVLAAFRKTELQMLQTALQQGLNSPLCSSIGRLFDAVAALAGFRQQMRFEGQAAMELEFALDGVKTDEHYDLPLAKLDASQGLDWSPLIQAMLADVQRAVPIGQISAKFHNALVEAVVSVAKQVGEQHVALSGGCFQNRYLTERTINRLQAEGFQPHWHQRVPPNDGGIALGQIAAARRPPVVSCNNQNQSTELACV